MKGPLRKLWLLTLTVLAPGCVLINPTDPYAGMGCADLRALDRGCRRRTLPRVHLR
jgi:hypothetical protein